MAERREDPETLFEVQRMLGEGAAGMVYYAERIASREPVAIKVVVGTDDAKKELRILETISHPNVVSYYGTWEKDSQLWIALEFCHGGAVSDLMEKLGRGLGLQELRCITCCSLMGLSYLHGEQLIHRDIKASNILLSSSGAKLADFGVSARLQVPNDRRCTFVGTPYWMSPEVCSRGEYDYKADIWSLGITVIEMVLSLPPLAHLHPIEAIEYIRKNDPPVLQSILQTSGISDIWPQSLHEFVQCCLVKDFESRPDALQLSQSVSF
ncbi:hypothetical protein GUITHDRAFT_88593 [Guillardia theta CCMP2712]|uniref:Protein kinase domain-containing protein n=1 Tax=Guillardia theta (strain CCMP2712) TaxID=905079 RepID=L1IXG4_GUITC|nr:hypothetical protein GUITHDRAFT_88593 [Guillardia theta CCMP2712]EKX40767.1 hypothetical protein GUITHDRAFT_88593 [Guillardia theta CCMP2712]|eukprot:XP_005827747.1 hypothetical protein GUITHDRAFT_88593 [Guillardia theta CCMP2712]